jgi:hypothetical protein
MQLQHDLEATFLPAKAATCIKSASFSAIFEVSELVSHKLSQISQFVKGISTTQQQRQLSGPRQQAM